MQYTLKLVFNIMKKKQIGNVCKVYRAVWFTYVKTLRQAEGMFLSKNVFVALSTESTSAEDESRECRKRHKSDSFSLTFDDSLSWCVIGGLHRERGNSESSDAQSNSVSSTFKYSFTLCWFISDCSYFVM